MISWIQGAHTKKISSLNLSPQNISYQRQNLSSQNLSNYKTYLTTKLIKIKHITYKTFQNVSKISNHWNVQKIVWNSVNFQEKIR